MQAGRTFKIKYHGFMKFMNDISRTRCSGCEMTCYSSFQVRRALSDEICLADAGVPWLGIVKATCMAFTWMADRLVGCVEQRRQTCCDDRNGGVLHVCCNDVVYVVLGDVVFSFWVIRVTAPGYACRLKQALPYAPRSQNISAQPTTHAAP
jgi:hypothetical protein